jgi:hypothetical protein
MTKFDAMSVFDWLSLAVMYCFAVYIIASICGFNDDDF